MPQHPIMLPLQDLPVHPQDGITVWWAAEKNTKADGKSTVSSTIRKARPFKRLCSCMATFPVPFCGTWESAVFAARVERSIRFVSTKFGKIRLKRVFLNFFMRCTAHAPANRYGRKISCLE